MGNVTVYGVQQALTSATGRRLSSPGVPDAGEVDAVMTVGRTGEVDLT